MWSNSAVDLINVLINLEQAHIPIDDFSMALWRLSNVDNVPGIDLPKEFQKARGGYRGIHDLNHTIRVVFWVLYLVEISNRLGYPIEEDEALSALYAALIHDLARKDDLPGGKHGRDAAMIYRETLQKYLSDEQLKRCLEAVDCHGFVDEPLIPDPVWMLLKDADALDRARLAPPGIFIGCDPKRLRLPVLTENTPVLEGCLAMSMLLLELMDDQDFAPGLFKTAANQMAMRLMRKTAGSDQPVIEATFLITDRIWFD